MEDLQFPYSKGNHNKFWELISCLGSRSLVFNLLSLEHADGFEIFRLHTAIHPVTYTVVSTRLLKWINRFYALYLVFQGIHTAFRKDSAYVLFLMRIKLTEDEVRVTKIGYWGKKLHLSYYWHNLYISFWSSTLWSKNELPDCFQIFM